MLLFVCVVRVDCSFVAAFLRFGERKQRRTALFYPYFLLLKQGPLYLSLSLYPSLFFSIDFCYCVFPNVLAIILEGSSLCQKAHSFPSFFFLPFSCSRDCALWRILRPRRDCVGVRAFRLCFSFLLDQVLFFFLLLSLESLLVLQTYIHSFVCFFLVLVVSSRVSFLFSLLASLSL